MGYPYLDGSGRLCVAVVDPLVPGKYKSISYDMWLNLCILGTGRVFHPAPFVWRHFVKGERVLQLASYLYIYIYIYIYIY